VKYVRFFWAPLEAALSFLKFSRLLLLFEKELIKISEVTASAK